MLSFHYTVLKHKIILPFHTQAMCVYSFYFNCIHSFSLTERTYQYYLCYCISWRKSTNAVFWKARGTELHLKHFFSQYFFKPKAFSFRKPLYGTYCAVWCQKYNSGGQMKCSQNCLLYYKRKGETLAKWIYCQTNNSNPWYPLIIRLGL